jgi:hypothetical protein
MQSRRIKQSSIKPSPHLPTSLEEVFRKDRISWTRKAAPNL